MASSKQPLRVLAVDDSPISRKLIEYSLTEESYEVVFAKNGKEALKLFAEHAPDVVITDWEMEDFTGPELCRKIRSEFREAYTYLVLLTSNSDKQSIADGLAAGADDYLTKPFDRDELRARVGVGRRVMEMHRAIEANNKRLVVEARTDALTGLANRRAVEEFAARQVAGSMRHGYPVWIVLADLHALNKINDSSGYAGGDVLLRAFADILKKNTRVSDMCGRVDGDRFVMVVTHTDEEGIKVLLSRLRGQIAARSLPLESANLSVDFGVAGSEGSKPIEFLQLMAQADAALLEAKRNGRRVAV
ncbi:MAG TPA: diguanylate cyclase [Candidatus Acidoferrum sp.]|jgi:diguanylate cyclase (GGDEF)-like protein